MPSCVAPCAETASCVRSKPYTVHGWRPISVVYQPASMATRPLGPIHRAQRRNRRERHRVPRQRSHALQMPSAIISMPSPAMMRKDQNTTAEGGRSRGANSFKAGIVPFQSCARIRPPRRGISTLYRVSSRSMSGQPNRISGVPSPPLFSQWPSMAASLAGWCSSVFKPCRSPITAWMGATISSIDKPIVIILRMAALSLPRSKCQAADATTSKAVARKAATLMCSSRYGNEGLKMTASQSTGTTRPSMISWPCGVCIQLFEAMIQVAEIKVPSATMAVANMCRPGPTRCQPNSITPRKPASRKKAVSTS